MTLREMRGRLGLTQKDVAEAIGVGIPCVSLYEAGKRSPNSKRMAALAELYGVSMEDVYDATKEGA